MNELTTTLIELIDNAGYLFAERPLALDDKAEKQLDATGRETLAALLPELKDVEPWTPEVLEACVRSFARRTQAG